MINILPKKALRTLKAYRPAVSENKGKDVIRLSVNEGAFKDSNLMFTRKDALIDFNWTYCKTISDFITNSPEFPLKRTMTNLLKSDC